MTEFKGNICATPEKASGFGKRSDQSSRKSNRVKSSSIPPPPTNSERTSALLRGLNLCLEHFDAPQAVLSSLEVQIHSYLDDSCSEKVWLQRCKYILTYPLAKYLKNELPSNPDKTFSFSGPLRNWVKPKLNAFNDENSRFWYSWFQAKRSTLPLSETIISESYKKHFETLTKMDPGDDITIDAIFQQKAFIETLEMIRKDLTENYKHGKEFIDCHAKTSACFTFPRSKGGQQNYLRVVSDLSSYSTKSFQQGETEDSYLSHDTPVSPVLHSMGYRPWVYTKEGIIYDYVFEVSCPDGEHEWKTLKDALKNHDLERKLDCIIQAVLEPNKIRIISKGEALPYYACKPLQLAIAKALKKISCFELTGRPVNLEDIYELSKMALPTDLWFSIDYSAATDGLSIKYSMRILNYITQDLDPEFKKLINQVLGPHRLYYPDSSAKKTDYWGDMTNGQLMGSILSFPILCIANLGVYLLTTAEHQKLWSTFERLNATRINGDDMVYAAPKELWAKHVEIGKKVGLEMSVGKAYTHREYLNINSTSFHCPLHKMKPVSKLPMREIGYLNVGLFFGQHKVQGKIEVAESHSGKAKEGIVANINCLLSGARQKKKISLLKKLLKVQKDTILEETSTVTRSGQKIVRNLFTPISLGGMGVRSPDGWKFRISNDDIYIAHGIINELPGCSYTSQLPLPGYPILPKIETFESVPWAPKSGGELVEKPVLPMCRVKTSKIKDLLRIGFYRFGPNSSCSEAPVPTRLDTITRPLCSYESKRLWSAIDPENKVENPPLMFNITKVVHLREHNTKLFVSPNVNEEKSPEIGTQDLFKQALEEMFQHDPVAELNNESTSSGFDLHQDCTDYLGTQNFLKFLFGWKNFLGFRDVDYGANLERENFQKFARALASC